VNIKNAYILFYLRDKGQGLDAAVSAPLQTNGGSIVAGMKKRHVREDDAEEDAGVKVTKPFIGPQMPSPLAERPKPTPLTTSKADPQADLVRKKIEAARSNKALPGLSAYSSDSEEEDTAKPPPSSPPVLSSLPPSSLPPSSPMSPTTPAAAAVDVSSPTVAASSPAAILSTSSFYGATPSTSQKRKHPDSWKDRDRAPKRSPLGPSLNPFGNSRLTYGKNKRRPRPI
jgi:ubiquitin carboxyl-terminal hydrolase 36/42